MVNAQSILLSSQICNYFQIGLSPDESRLLWIF